MLDDEGEIIIECTNVDCKAICETRSNETEHEAMRAWNTRAEEPAEPKTAHWDICCDGYYPFCSHCGEATQHMSRFCPNCGAKMVTRRHGE